MEHTVQSTESSTAAGTAARTFRGSVQFTDQETQQTSRIRCPTVSTSEANTKNENKLKEAFRRCKTIAEAKAAKKQLFSVRHTEDKRKGRRAHVKINVQGKEICFSTPTRADKEEMLKDKAALRNLRNGLPVGMTHDEVQAKIDQLWKLSLIHISEPTRPY